MGTSQELLVDQAGQNFLGEGFPGWGHAVAGTSIRDCRRRQETMALVTGRGW